MLDIKLNGDILTVVQVTHSCEATHKQYSYMNIKTWHKNGRTLKIDDTILDYKMVDRDIEWCKKNITHSNSIFIDGNSNIEDLAQMSKCKDNIIANSSFSWWGAWLNRNLNKRIICPKEWFGSNNSDDKDIRPENWVQI
jgi:hypothetical protein